MEANVEASAAAAATREDATPDLGLVEAQIHHFLTHGEILNDSRGRALLQTLREKELQIKQRVKEAEALAQREAQQAQAQAQAQASSSQQQTQLPSAPLDATVTDDGRMHKTDALELEDERKNGKRVCCCVWR